MSNEFQLNYKASNIAKAEIAFNANFFQTISSLSGTPAISDLLFLIRAGGGTDEYFDELFEKGIKETVVTIIEAINRAGFLGQQIDLSEMEKAFAEENKPSKSETSLKAGNETKA